MKVTFDLRAFTYMRIYTHFDHVRNCHIFGIAVGSHHVDIQLLVKSKQLKLISEFDSERRKEVRSF